MADTTSSFHASSSCAPEADQLDTFLNSIFSDSQERFQVRNICSNNNLGTPADLREFLSCLETFERSAMIGFLKPLAREKLFVELFGNDYQQALGMYGNTEETQRYLQKNRRRRDRVEKEPPPGFEQSPSTRRSKTSSSSTSPSEILVIDPSALSKEEDTLGLGQYTKNKDLICTITSKLCRGYGIQKFAELIELVDFCLQHDEQKFYETYKLEKHEVDLLRHIHSKHTNMTAGEEVIDFQMEDVPSLPPQDAVHPPPTAGVAPLELKTNMESRQKKKDVSANMDDSDFESFPQRNTYEIYERVEYLDTGYYDDAGKPTGKTILGYIEKARRRSDGKIFVLKFNEINKAKQNMTRPHSEHLGREINLHKYVSDNCEGECFVKLLDVHKYNKYIVCVQEYANGEGLYEYATKIMPVEFPSTDHERETHVKNLFRHMINALNTLHNLGIAHFDVSLENLVVHRQGTDLYVKIIDFGMALGNMSPNRWNIPKRTPVGKRRYWAPEQWVRGKDNTISFDARANDIHCLGVCLFFLLLGFPPFNISDSEKDDFAKRYQKGRLKSVLRDWNINPMPSDNALDIVQKMLLPEKKRIKMSDILQHPWLT